MTDTAEINSALDHMRALSRNPIKRAQIQLAWDEVCSRLKTHYLAMTPLPTRFEVYHMNETARARFACAILAGHTLTKCVHKATECITGPTPVQKLVI